MDPARVAKKHDEVTRENGPYMANGSMRTLRAIYNHARKTNKSLPSDNPADAVDWKEEERRNTGMGLADLKGWFMELAALENPVRRGSTTSLSVRISADRAAEAKPEHIDFRRRILHIPKPKGGKRKAFDVPLSRQMILCLIRASRFGRQMYPLQAQEWLFPADSASGHLAETKEDREILSKCGNDLRQTFRTIATAAGVSEIDANVLPGVNAAILRSTSCSKIICAASSKQLAVLYLPRWAHRSPKIMHCGIGSGDVDSGRPPDGTISAGKQVVVRLAAGITLGSF